MIYKQLDFPGMDPETGQIFTEAYSPGDSLLKLAGAKNYDPALEKFLKGLKKSPSKIYVIVTALGSGEYYGANVNNDFYEEKELLNPNPQYGYTTFLTAGIFRFHLNKDKTKSFGIVVFATYNHRMHRVELVVEIDKALARTHGHESLVAALENGEHPSVSMGCRVKFDVCFPAGTRVLSPQGEVPIESISAGDMVFSHLGRIREVTKTFERKYTGPLTSLRGLGVPDPLLATGNHPVFIVREEVLRSCRGSANGKKRRHTSCDGGKTCSTCGSSLELTPEEVAATDVQVGDYLCFPREVGSIKAEVSPARARLLGYYLGDGNLMWRYRGRNRDGARYVAGFAVTFSQTGKESLSRFLDTCAEAGLKNAPLVYEDPARNAVCVHVHDREFAEWLLRLGGATKQKAVPIAAFGWPIESRLHLLGALIDTDGSQDHSINAGSIRFSNTLPALSRGVLFLCRSLGIFASLNVQRDVVTPYAPNGIDAYYQVCFPASMSELLSQYATKVRPYTRSLGSAAVMTNEFYLAPVVEKEEQYVEDYTVYNLAVSEDESYIAEGWGVHNCSVCGHKSRTRADYCTHAKNFLGKILPNGRKVYVTNPDMVFFDLSFVLVGADKVSFVMEKVAGYALAKVSYDKISTLVKEIPDLAHHLDPLFKREDTLPQSVMDSMGGLTLPQATGALLGKGIILKPVEFQYMVLQRKECPQEARDLLRRNIVFAPMGAPAGLNMIQESFMDYPLGLPAQVLTRRCFSSPLLAARVPNLVRAQPPDIEIPMQSPLSGMLSSTYLDYRRNILDMLPSLMIRFPLEKTASPVNALWVTLLPILYLFSAHLRSKEREHIPLSGTERFIMQHPIMSAAAIAGLGLGVKELRNLLV